MTNRASYPSDLTDKQWELIEAYIPAAKPGGCLRKTDPREIANAIFYILPTGVVGVRCRMISLNGNGCMGISASGKSKSCG